MAISVPLSIMRCATEWRQWCSRQSQDKGIYPLAQVRLLYFAWIRERVGCAEEVVEVPADIVDVAGLVQWLRERGQEYESAFADPQTVRAAIDQQHVKADAAIAGAREIAFFPPVTGG